MGCPVNQCKRINPFVDSQGIRKVNKDLVKHYDAEPLPTLIGKPERITALNARILEDEKRTNMAAALTRKIVSSSVAGYRIRFKTKIAEEAAGNVSEAVLNTMQFCPSKDFIIPEEALNENKQFLVTIGIAAQNVPVSAVVTNNCGAVARVTNSSNLSDIVMVMVLVDLTKAKHKDIEITLVIGRAQQSPGGNPEI